MNSTDGDDGTVDDVILYQNPALVVGDDGDAVSLEDAPDGDGVADAYEGGSHPDPAS
jgi:hypothetical protein